ncbi:hypothetical protein FA15DRAFT_557690, partial [Coprinopsis marcescibilis]
CKAVLDEFLASNKNPSLANITLSHVTLGNRINSMQNIQDSNAEKAWLMKEEEEQVISAVIQHGEMGIPFSRHRLEEQVNSILRARLGNKFGKEGVGQNYIHRLCERNRDQI